MKLCVVWCEDRWGQEARVVAAFSEHDAAVDYARKETLRTEALAEERKEAWHARLFFVTDLEVDAPERDPITRALAGHALSDRVEKPGVDLSGVRRPREDRSVE